MSLVIAVCLGIIRIPAPPVTRPFLRADTIVPMNEPASQKTGWLSWSNLVIALLQSICTAVFAINGVRILIGIGALAAVAAPAREWHQDSIRIPMLLLSLAGVFVNLYVIWRIRRLRNRPAAQWRVQPVSAKELRSERLQIGLAVLTLVLLAAEQYLHVMYHHPHHG